MFEGGYLSHRRTVCDEDLSLSLSYTEMRGRPHGLRTERDKGAGLLLGHLGRRLPGAGPGRASTSRLRHHRIGLGSLRGRRLADSRQSQGIVLSRIRSRRPCLGQLASADGSLCFHRGGRTTSLGDFHTRVFGPDRSSGVSTLLLPKISAKLVPNALEVSPAEQHVAVVDPPLAYVVPVEHVRNHHVSYALVCLPYRVGDGGA